MAAAVAASAAIKAARVTGLMGACGRVMAGTRWIRWSDSGFRPGNHGRARPIKTMQGVRWLAPALDRNRSDHRDCSY